MEISRDNSYVYVNLTQEEFKEYVELAGFDESKEVLSVADMAEIAKIIYSELLNNIGNDTKGFEHFIDDYTDTSVELEIWPTEEGISLRMHPVKDAAKPNFNAETIYQAIEHSFEPEIEDTKEVIESQGNLLDDKVLNQILDAILKSIYARIPDPPLPYVLAVLTNSDVFRAYVLMKYRATIKKHRSVDKGELIRNITDEFYQKVEKRYELLSIEYFYKMTNLQDVLKAVLLVKNGKLIRIKDTYYIVTKNKIFSMYDYATLVDSFIYADESILAYIKDGELCKKEGN